jgi:dihydroorotase
LQTFAAQLVELSHSIDIEDLLDKVTHQPRKILGLERVVIDEESRANLTLFNPSLEWTFLAEDSLSKSRNSPWLNKPLTGKVVATFNNSRHWLDA